LASFGLMRVTLFGTRGSLAAPGAETTRYGGNTSTVEVCANDGSLLILDAGTGIRRLAKQIPPATARIDILLTHLHMDHIQGLGFFRPLYDPDVDVHIWGPASSMLRLEARLSRYLSPPLFPVHLRDLPKVVCHVPWRLRVTSHKAERTRIRHSCCTTLPSIVRWRRVLAA